MLLPDGSAHHYAFAVKIAANDWKFIPVVYNANFVYIKLLTAVNYSKDERQLKKRLV